MSHNAFLSTVVLDLFGKCGDLQKFEKLYAEMTINEGRRIYMYVEAIS